MIRIIFVLLIILAIPVRMTAQKSIKAMPVSLDITALKTSSSIPHIRLSMPEYEQESVSTEPAPIRYGVFRDTTIDIRNAGRMDRIEGKGKVWRLTLQCPDAISIQVLFKKFQIPENARLFLYDPGMNRISGAFTRHNNRPDSLFTIADFKGNVVIIEYFEPENPDFEGKLIIGSIGLGFSDPLVSEAGPGFININCPIGKVAQLAKHAVCKMTFRSGSFQVTCSGGLINNVRNDGTPYFLTANHCLSEQDEAASLTTYFNYENAGCNGPLGESPTLTGASLLATGRPSDFTLLLLDDVPPPEYQPFYGGWDSRNEPTDSVLGVHVPYNETKKVSLDYDSIISNPVTVIWDDDSRSPIGSHWIIGFDDGGTSQGSSGSPLFNSDNQIIGQLHGGSDEMAYYGKLSYSFAYKAPGYHTMRHYLDPDSTGTQQIEGYSPVDNIPDAFFTTRFEQVCLNSPITFSDYSVFGPYQREWVITPSSYDFTGETNGSSENPLIEFLQDTVYSVTLRLSVNNEVVSSETIQIMAGDIKVNVLSETSELCDCDFDRLLVKAEGADDFTWSILPGDENKITLGDTTGEQITIFKAPAFETDSSYQFGILVAGTQATCTDTLLFEYTLLRQTNDDIHNAIELSYGMSETYSNTCATVEDGEPVPPFVSCTTQDSWCDEYGTGEDIVENSVWFKFVAGPTGRVSISSSGMDNQIALYEADSSQAILDGDYKLLGANDDRTDTDYRPILRNETVIPGNTYWIQVDGSGGGLEDNFTITINSLVPTTATDNTKLERISVYPQPAGERFYLSHPAWVNGNQITIRVLNASGILVNQSVRSLSDGMISVQCGDWAPGLYIISAETGNNRYITQLVKR